jgi:hypothetical protein
MPCSHGSSGIIIIKPNATKQNFIMTTTILLYILQKYYPKKPAHFLKLHYDISCQEPKVNGHIVTSALPNSHISHMINTRCRKLKSTTLG